MDKGIADVEFMSVTQAMENISLLSGQLTKAEYNKKQKPKVKAKREREKQFAEDVIKMVEGMATDLDLVANKKQKKNFIASTKTLPLMKEYKRQCIQDGLIGVEYEKRIKLSKALESF